MTRQRRGMHYGYGTLRSPHEEGVAGRATQSELSGEGPGTELRRLLRGGAVQCRRGTMQRMAEDKAGKGRAGGVWASAWVRLNLRYCDRT